MEIAMVGASDSPQRVVKGKPQRTASDLRPRKSSKIRDVRLGDMRVPPERVTQRKFIPAAADRIAAELDLNLLGLPCVNHRDGVFWLFDGQHRVAALKTFGFTDDDVVTCEVFENLTDQEMARMFRGRDARRAVSKFDDFFIACTAGEVAQVAVRNTVEGLGLSIQRSVKGADNTNRLIAVGALMKVYRTGGLAALTKALKTLKESYGGDSDAFEGKLIEGLGLIYHRYGVKVRTDQLVDRLASQSPGWLLRRAHSQQQRTGNQLPICVAAVVVELYNKNLGPRSNHRLPGWWKDDE